MKYLGCNIGFMKDGMYAMPKIVTECRDRNHILKSEEIGKCLIQYSCKSCGFFYKVDSSG